MRPNRWQNNLGRPLDRLRRGVGRRIRAYRFRNIPAGAVPSRFVINISASCSLRAVNGRRAPRISGTRKLVLNAGHRAPYLKEGDNVIAATVWNYDVVGRGASFAVHRADRPGETERESAVDTDSS